MSEDDDTTTLAATLSSLAGALQVMADAEAAATTTTTNYSTSGDSNNLFDNFPLAGQILASVQGNLSLISEDDELKLLNYPSRREDLSTAIPLTVIFALLLITGCIGNLCTAIVIARPKNRYMHTATNYYLFSLAMSDFLFLILGLPQEMYALWQRYPYAFGESFCIIRSYLSEASTYASILTISAFTIERYVAICHPLWAHTMSQLPRAITSIVIIWILAAICAIPPAAQLGIVTQRGPITNRTLGESAQCAQKRTIYENLFAVSAIVFFIVPMVIVTVLYILIALELRRSSKMNSQIQKQTSSQVFAAGQHSQSGSTSHLHQAGCKEKANNHRTHQAHHNHSHHLHHHHHHHHHHPQHHLHRNHNQHCNSIAKTNDLHKSLKHHEQLPATTTWCQQHQDNNNQANNNTDLQVTQSQQLLPSSNLNEKVQLGPANGQLGERPKSALGAGDQLCSSPTCCMGPARGGKQVSGSLAGSLARLQLPSLLAAYNPKAWLWSNSSLAAASVDRPTSAAAATCCEDGRQHHEQVCECNEPGDQPEDSSRRPVSRQHSPLSYHESLIQRSCPTCRRPVGATGAPTKPNHLSHQQMSLPQTPISASCTVVQQLERRPHPCHDQHLRAVASHQQLINHRHLDSHRHRNHHHHYHHNNNNNNHHHHHHHHHHHLLHHNHSNLKALFHQQQQASHSRRSAAASSKKSVVRMLVAVVVSFFICWLPFHAQRLLAAYLAKLENQNQLLLDIYAKITYISGVMYYLSSTINPLLYQLMSAKFRLAFKETFKCSLFRCGAIMYYSCCCFCLPWRTKPISMSRRGPHGDAKTSASLFVAPPTAATKRLRCSPTNSMREQSNATNGDLGQCCCCSCTCSSCHNQTIAVQDQQTDKQVSVPSTRAHPALDAEPSTSIVSNNLPSSSSCLSCQQQQHQQTRANSIKSSLATVLIRFFPSTGRLARRGRPATSCHCQMHDSRPLGPDEQRSYTQHECRPGGGKVTLPGEHDEGGTCAPSTPLLCVHSVVEQQLAATTSTSGSAHTGRVQPPGAGTRSVFKLMRGQTPVGGLSTGQMLTCQEENSSEQSLPRAPTVCSSLVSDQVDPKTEHDDDDENDKQREARELLPCKTVGDTTCGRMEELVRPTNVDALEQQPPSSGNSSQGASPDQLASSVPSSRSPSSTNEMAVNQSSDQPREVYLALDMHDNRSPSSKPRPKLDSTESGSSGTGDLLRTANSSLLMADIDSNQTQPRECSNDSTRRRRRSLQQMRASNNNNINNNNNTQRDLYQTNRKLTGDYSHRHQMRQRRKSSSASATASRLEVDAKKQPRFRKTSTSNHENNNSQGNICSSLSSSERHLDSKRHSVSTTTTSAMILDDNASVSTTNSSFQLTSGCSNNQPLNQSGHSMELVQL